MWVTTYAKVLKVPGERSALGRREAGEADTGVVDELEEIGVRSNTHTVSTSGDQPKGQGHIRLHVACKVSSHL